MIHHFVNILTWRDVIKLNSLSRKIYIDGFLLQVLILLLKGRWLQKTSGLMYFNRKLWSAETLYLTRDGLQGYFNEVKLPFWKNENEIVLTDELIGQLNDYNDIVIGISSIKQDVLACQIDKVFEGRKNIFCLGAAVYLRTSFTSENVFITLGLMLFSSPRRTTIKLLTSLKEFFKQIKSCSYEVSQLLKEIN